MFHHHWADTELSPIVMDGSSLKEAPSHECLLGLKLSLDLKWNSSLQSFAKDAGKMVGSLYRSS